MTKPQEGTLVPSGCQEITKEEYLVGVTNSISKKYPDLRSKSKAPTFALQYLGTEYTLHKRSGFPMEQAKEIYNAYHDLYKVSGQFNKNNEKFMAEHGYIECAFGLRLRTPIIEKCVIGNSHTPYEAEAEIRSGNNAVTQSWGMLLNRAMIATNNRIIAAGYENDILPINLIHDAGYFLIKNNPIFVKFLNDVLIEEMSWNDHPAIRSTEVPMAAELDIGYSWDKMKTLKNHLTIEEIIHELKTLP